MKRTLAAALFLALFAPGAFAQSWKPGTYHDLTPGKSSREAVVKAFGKPSQKRKPSLHAFAGEGCCDEYVYSGKSDNGGDLSIAIGKSGSVIYIVDAYKTASTRSKAYKKYGKDWHSRAYSTASCAASGGLEPIYRDPRGNLELVEYPAKGILLWPSDDAIDFYGAVYLSHAPGLAKAPACVKEKPHTSAPRHPKKR